MKFPALMLLTTAVVLASEGALYKNVSCGAAWPSSGPTAGDCRNACAYFAGGTVSYYGTYYNSSCYVSITQLNVASITGQVVTDACNALVAECGSTNKTSEFRGTDKKTEEHGGTIRITNAAQTFPANENQGVASVSTDFEGEYEVRLDDCVAALKNLQPTAKGLPQKGVQFLNGTAGGCNVTMTPAGQFAATDLDNVLRGGQDILTIPANCDEHGLCRTFMNSSIAGHGGKLFSQIVTFSQVVQS